MFANYRTESGLQPKMNDEGLRAYVDALACPGPRRTNPALLPCGLGSAHLCNRYPSRSGNYGVNYLACCRLFYSCAAPMTDTFLSHNSQDGSETTENSPNHHHIRLHSSGSTRKTGPGLSKKSFNFFQKENNLWNNPRITLQN